MQGVSIGLRINRDRSDAHFRAGANQPYSYFTPIGDKDFLNQWH